MTDTNETSPVERSEAVRRLTDADFAEAKELYELGKATIAQLSEQYSVSRQTLSKRFRDAGVTHGSRSHEIAAATGAAAKGLSAATAARFEDRRPEYIEETKQQGYQILKQAKLLGQKIIADAIKATRPLETVDGDLRALGRYVKAQTELLDSTLRLLGADDYEDEADLPTFKVEDLTIDDILEHMEKSGVDPDPTNVNTDGLEKPKNGA